MSSAIRYATWGVSALLHAGLALSLVAVNAGGRALEAGDGADVFHIEQGIAIEGLSQVGAASEVVAAASDVAQEAQAAVVPEAQPVEPPKEPPPDEVPVVEPPPEKIEKSEVITAKAEPVAEQEVLRETPKPVEREVPREVAAADAIPEKTIVEDQSPAARQTGGDPTLRMAYLGKLRGQIERKKVNPNTRDSGTVVVRFTVDAQGKLVSREVATSSGSKRLDDAALAAVERASPYPPFPDGLGAPTLVVNVPFRFVTR